MDAVVLPRVLDKEQLVQQFQVGSQFEGTRVGHLGDGGNSGDNDDDDDDDGITGDSGGCYL